MNGIEKITARIQEDSQKEINAILAEAKAKAAEITAQAQAEAKAAAPAATPAAPAPSPPPAPGSAGEVKLFDVPDKEAAMIMAIVADKMGKPLNELRFKSIKEVK